MPPASAASRASPDTGHKGPLMPGVTAPLCPVSLYPSLRSACNLLPTLFCFLGLMRAAMCRLGAIPEHEMTYLQVHNRCTT